MSNDPTESHLPQPNGNSPSDVAAEQAMIERARAALESTPETIGPYRIIERIGQGGMGEVYRAEQRVPIRRQVAIKLIKLGMDTKQVIARFEAERQALALMDHPNIAKVLDASTDESGRPYFVMELVKGIPIHEYADKNQLTIQERLILFAQVCHAIQHAHHKGVIHRDIKPSNVLTYTQDGKPHAKIIDFGIAKAIAQQLTDQTFYTLLTQFLGTPQYMSPEQAEGNLDIDTRTDVYSLGVMLYELLTGTTPFSLAELKANAVDQIRKIICETEPPKPSTRLTIETATLNAIAAARRVEPTRLGSLVRGELDWIVMMALDKDRRRRYDTPNDLANDIEAYLQGERVKAAPPSRLYLMQKFAKRNKGAMAVTSILTISLGIGLAGTTWQWYRADRNAKTAELSSAEAKVARQRAEDSLQQAERERELADQERRTAIAQRDNAEFEAYVANLNFANGAVERGEYQEAQEYLKRCPEPHRGWEWDFLQAMSRDKLDLVEFSTYEHCHLDPYGKAALKISSKGNAALYFTKSLNETVKLKCDAIPSDGTVNLLVSQDESKLVFSSKSISEHIIFIFDASGRLIAKRPMDDLRIDRLIAISPNGDRIATRLKSKEICIISADQNLRTIYSLPSSEKTQAFSFVQHPDSQDTGLLVVDIDKATLHAFENDHLIQHIVRDEDLLSYITNYEFAIDSNPNFGVRNLADFIGCKRKDIITQSNDDAFCVVKDDSQRIALTSVLTRNRIASLPAGKEYVFSRDSQSLWVGDEKGTDIYEINGHTSDSLNIVLGKPPMVAHSAPLSGDTICIDDEIFDRDAVRVGTIARLGEFTHLIIGDRIVEQRHAYNYGGGIVHLTSAMSAISNVLEPDTELAGISLGQTINLERSKGQRSPKRQLSVSKYGLRVEDTERARLVTHIRTQWPTDAHAIATSDDARRIYVIANDNYCVCYDARNPEERRAWNIRVHEQMDYASKLTQELWDSDLPYDKLRRELAIRSSGELRESALHLLRIKQSWCERKSKMLFESKRFEYIGRKEDWQAEAQSQCPDKRMWALGGPLFRAIENWHAMPAEIDTIRFHQSILNNQVPHSIRENWDAVFNAYSASSRSPLDAVLGAIGLLRMSRKDDAKQILLSPGMDDATLFLAALRQCALTMIAIQERDLTSAREYWAIATSSRIAAISSGYSHIYYDECNVFFDEVSLLLDNLQKED